MFVLIKIMLIFDSLNNISESTAGYVGSSIFGPLPSTIKFVKLCSHELASNNYVNNQGHVDDVFAIVPYTDNTHDKVAYTSSQGILTEHVEFNNHRNLSEITVRLQDEKSNVITFPETDDVHVIMRAFYTAP